MIKIEITVPSVLDEKECKTIRETAQYLLGLANASERNTASEEHSVPPIAKNDEFTRKEVAEMVSNKVCELLSTKVKEVRIEKDSAAYDIEIPNLQFTNALAETVDGRLVILGKTGIPICNPVSPEFSNPFVRSTENLIPKAPLDSSGLPWDARIHSKTQSKREDGTWKPKRGVSFTEQAKIEKEIIIPKPPAYTITETEVSEIPLNISIPNPSQPDAIPKPPAIDNFPDFMVNITDLIVAGKLNRAQILEAVKSVGLESLPIVATRSDLIPAINAKIKEMVGL